MKYAQSATTTPRKVRTVAELQMALADKARGQHIATLRKRKRLTQQAMAEKLGIAYRTYQSWEAGTLPEWHNLEKLAVVLGVKPEYIIGDEPIADPTQLDRIEAKLDQLQATMARVLIELELLATAQRKSTQGRSSGAKTARPRKANPGS